MCNFCALRQPLLPAIAPKTALRTRENQYLDRELFQPDR